MKHRPQFWLYKCQIFFGKTSNTFWSHTVSFFFDILPHFEKKIFCKNFCFENAQNILPDICPQNVKGKKHVFPTFCDPQTAIYIPWWPEFFWKDSTWCTKLKNFIRSNDICSFWKIKMDFTHGVCVKCGRIFCHILRNFMK